MVAGTLCLQATTLEYLSLDDMIEQSTAIVRGRVSSSSASLQGPLIYTHYTIEVLEQWKGPGASVLDVVLPGGESGGLRQNFAGTPKLVPGEAYLLFLWTGPSGLTHVIGLSQGVFRLSSDGAGGLVASRAATNETMINPRTGRTMSDEPMQIRLSDLRTRVSALAARKGASR